MEVPLTIFKDYLKIKNEPLIFGSLYFDIVLNLMLRIVNIENCKFYYL